MTTKAELEERLARALDELSLAGVKNVIYRWFEQTDDGAQRQLVEVAEQIERETRT